MDHPTNLILQDVRCFDGEQHGQLRGITLLIGENSTGKTTFLGCYRALHQMFPMRGFNQGSPDFNEDPFTMGSFRDIVRSRRGPKGRIDEFKLGFALQKGSRGPSYSRLTATFREEGSQPIVSSLRFHFNEELFLELERQENGTVFRIPGHGTQGISIPFNQAAFFLRSVTGIDEDSLPLHMHPRWAPVVGLLQVIRNHDAGSGNGGRESGASKQRTFLLPRLSELIPVAPLRSKPKRTYDPVRESSSPEGEHVPMLMMRLDRTDDAQWGSLHDDLVAFGQESGLFSDIKVKRHGKQMSDPFQLQVKVRSGPHANIVDVGYGISQSLPILVDIMAPTGSSRGSRRRENGRTFLLQQPEVHLHPRGQAQLANLFIAAFKKRRNRFLIETHSDYIVDRVRISVRQGLLKPNDVSILYFEPTAQNGNAVNIHNMTLDVDGNLLGAPAGYRDFFLKETDKLLGFAD